MTTRFVALPFSPWSIKAKWALDHHRVEYRSEAYLPMIGEPFLRLRRGRWRGRVSVPALFTSEGAVEGSLAIARYAEQVGSGAPLFPEEHDEAIARWDARSEKLLEAGRAISMRRMLASPQALAENVPGPRLGTLLAPIGALGVSYLVRKYGVEADAARYAEERRAGLDTLRGAIGAGDHLVGGALSYADVVMAVATFGLRPPGREIDHLGEATRACWTDEALADQYGDLLAWRDRILAAWFPRV